MTSLSNFRSFVRCATDFTRRGLMENTSRFRKISQTTSRLVELRLSRVARRESSFPNWRPVTAASAIAPPMAHSRHFCNARRKTREAVMRRSGDASDDYGKNAARPVPPPSQQATLSSVSSVQCGQCGLSSLTTTTYPSLIKLACSLTRSPADSMVLSCWAYIPCHL